MAGHARTFYVDDGNPFVGMPTMTLGRFTANSVEIAYGEFEVVSPRDLTQPYFVFRNADGVTVWVPAIDSRWLASR